MNSKNILSTLATIFFVSMWINTACAQSAVRYSNYEVWNRGGDPLVETDSEKFDSSPY